MKPLVRMEWLVPVFVGLACFAVGAQAGETTVSIVDGKWHLNGKVTYPGATAEGLLMNVRMVNATFEDANLKTRPDGFDSDANRIANETKWL